MQRRHQQPRAAAVRTSRRVVTADGRLLSSREQQEEALKNRRRPVVFIWQRCVWLGAILLTCAVTNPANDPYTIMSLLSSSGSGSGTATTTTSSISSSFFWSDDNTAGQRTSSSSWLSSSSITNYGMFAVKERRTSLEFWALTRQPLWTCSLLIDPMEESANNSDDRRGLFSFWPSSLPFHTNTIDQQVICESLRDLLSHGKSSPSSSIFFPATAGGGGTSSSRNIGIAASSSHDMSFATYRIVCMLLILGAAIVACVQDVDTLYYHPYYDYSTSATATIRSGLQRLHDAFLSLFLPDERDVLGFLFWNLFDAAVLVLNTLQRMDQLVALQSHKSWFRIVNADYHFEIPVSLFGCGSSTIIRGRLDASQFNYIFSLAIFFLLPTLINAIQAWLFHNGHNIGASSTTTGRFMIHPEQQRSSLLQQPSLAVAVAASSSSCCFLGFELVGAVSLGYLRGTKQEQMRILWTKYSVDLIAMAWIRVISVTLSRVVLAPTTTTTTTTGPTSSYSSLFYSACGVLATWTTGFVAGSIMGQYQHDNQVLQTFVRDIWKEAGNIFNALFDTGR